MARNAVVVVGLGNELMGDEGVGIRVVNALPEAYVCSAIDLYDLGTATFRILHVLEHREKLVIIDCAFMGEPPGTIRRFTLDEARSVKRLAHLSAHEGDPLSIIGLSNVWHTALPEIVIFGVEPFSLELSESLSPPVNQKLSEYLAAVAAECGLSKRDGGH